MNGDLDPEFESQFSEFTMDVSIQFKLEQHHEVSVIIFDTHWFASLSGW